MQTSFFFLEQFNNEEDGNPCASGQQIPGGSYGAPNGDYKVNWNLDRGTGLSEHSRSEVVSQPGILVVDSRHKQRSLPSLPRNDHSFNKPRDLLGAIGK